MSTYLVRAYKLASQARSLQRDPNHLFLVVPFPIPYSLRLLRCCQTFSDIENEQPLHLRLSDHFLHDVLALCCLYFSGFFAERNSFLSTRELGILYDDKVSR